MLRIIDKTENTTLTIDGIKFTVKPMTVRDRMALGAKIAALDAQSDNPVKMTDVFIKMLADQVVSIEGYEDRKVADVLGCFETFQDLVELSKALITNAGLDEAEASN